MYYFKRRLLSSLEEERGTADSSRFLSFTVISIFARCIASSKRCINDYLVSFGLEILSLISIVMKIMMINCPILPKYIIIIITIIKSLNLHGS